VESAQSPRCSIAANPCTIIEACFQYLSIRYTERLAEFLRLVESQAAMAFVPAIVRLPYYAKLPAVRRNDACLDPRHQDRSGSS